MGSLWSRARGGATEERNTTTGYSMSAWHRAFAPGAQVNYGGVTHQAFRMDGTGNGAALRGNSIVYACEAKRVKVFSEARFQFRRLGPGGPASAELFGTGALRLLEEPWPGATTQDLLAVAELDYATRGNSYWTVADGYLLWLDPDRMRVITEAWVDPVSGHRVGEQLVGYAHVHRDEVTIYDPRDIAHFKPVPNPDNRFVGLSWIGQCLADIDADGQFTRHKVAGLRNNAQLGHIVSLDASVPPDEFRAFVSQFREAHEGPANAGKTVFLGGGADVKTVGQTFQALDMKAVQGATETRIAACSGVSPVIAGLSEGLSGSSLNAGNYSSAKRNFVDSEMRPAWRAFAGAFQWLVDTPAGAQLWYDDQDIPFLRDDVLDQAEVLARDAQTARTLIDAGFDPDAVTAAVRARDLSRLVGAHAGLFSVQLQPPGANQQPAQEGAAT